MAEENNGAGRERPQREGEGREQPEPGFQSKRSERFEGWNAREGRSARGSEWGWRDVDRAEEYGGYHTETGAPPARSEGPEKPEYGGPARRSKPPSPQKHQLPYDRPDEHFERRERPGYQADERENGLALRHHEFVRGPYAGLGPRGYRRSDERVHEEVCERLTEAGDVDASAIDVRVVGGEVTLRGTVASRAQKRRAEDLAEEVRGVRDVHNRLRLQELERPGRGPPGESAEGAWEDEI